MSLSVGQLARRFGLSRSTLLYYDRIGLLRPSLRSSQGHRLYTEAETRRLETICSYRSLGLSLEDVARLLDGRPEGADAVLARQVAAIDAELAQLQTRRRMLTQLFTDQAALTQVERLDKKRWVELLRAAGLDEEGMHRWHVEFERTAPEAHRQLLVSLGIPRAEIARIRRWARPVEKARPARRK